MSAVSSSGSPWPAYNRAQAGRRPRALCVDVLAYAGAGDGRLAIDLGSGAGIESKAMLDQGWRVLAVDSDPAMPAHLRRLVQDHSGLETRVASFTDVELPAADLVHAGYALPFVAPDDFWLLWQRIRRILRPDGWLAVDLFGDRDDWAGRPGMTFLTRLAAEALLDGLHVVSFDEEDANRPAFTGPKHWHVFHVIARSNRR